MALYTDFRQFVWTMMVTTLACSVAMAGDKKTSDPPKEAPDGWVFVDEDVWLVAPDTTGQHFHQAIHKFTGKQYKEAASQIRKATAFVLFEGRRETNTDAKQALMDAVLDLERLADGIERERITWAKKLDHTFARTDQAMARHFALAAGRTWERQAHVMAGQEFHAASIHMNSGFHWANQEMSREAIDADSKAMTVAEALIEGSRRDDQQVRDAIAGIIKEVDQLGKVVAAYPRIEGSSVARPKASPLPPVEGFVLVEDDVWFVNYDEPGHLFHETRSEYNSKHYSAAAHDLNRAAAYVRTEGRLAKDTHVKTALMDSVLELEKLAKDAERGTHIATKRFDQAFARAHYNLARAYHAAAQAAWSHKNTARAGHALKAALANLEHGLTWSGHELEAAAVRTANDAESLCGKMTEGTGWVPEEVGKAIEFVGKEIETLGQEI